MEKLKDLLKGLTRTSQGERNLMNLFVEAMLRVLTRRKWPKEIMRTPLGVVIAWMKEEEEQNWLEKMVEIGDSPVLGRRLWFG